MDFPDPVEQDGFLLDPDQPGRRQAQQARQAQPRAKRTRYAYKVDRLSEGVLSSVLLGSANIDERKLEDHINTRAAQGYRLVFQVLEQKRTLLLGKRESLILTFESATS